MEGRGMRYNYRELATGTDVMLIGTVKIVRVKAAEGRSIGEARDDRSSN